MNLLCMTINIFMSVLFAATFCLIYIGLVWLIAWLPLPYWVYNVLAFLSLPVAIWIMWWAAKTISAKSERNFDQWTDPPPNSSENGT
jgi:hypothetical protein